MAARAKWRLTSSHAIINSGGNRLTIPDRIESEKAHAVPGSTVEDEFNLDAIGITFLE
ncbi:hypothetical protein [Cesiribacter sp. SM1]|uniref:hypothetical protein n=1 Tax=Cesiribacter sp. SM1 TaxID=2861196 RepID=UPI001CD28973|nr:hypothetical protein [Cesiribacter sp. SM1]